MATKRTTVEIDPELVAEAQRLLGLDSMRATIEEALRRAVEADAADRAQRRLLALEHLRTLDKHLDLEVLASEEMWR